jgi:hypothetical protein
MACAHTNPPEVMERAESWLRERGIAEAQWSGLRIRHAENTPGGQWASVIIDIERRDGQWIVTDIDRRDAPTDETGLSIIA